MIRTIAIAFAGLMIAGAAVAEPMASKPGKWRTTSTFSIKMNMTGGMTMDMPGNTISTESCVKEGESFKPEDMAMENCTVSDLKQGPRSMSFALSCNQAGAQMTGNMSFDMNAAGDKGSGKMDIQGQMGGQGTMHMSATTSSELIGGC